MKKWLGKFKKNGKQKKKETRLLKEKQTNDALIKNFDDIKGRLEAEEILAEIASRARREQLHKEERAKFLS
ncbi:hypothetical protein Tco_0333011 [Tanacetum coccineum]